MERKSSVNSSVSHLCIVDINIPTECIYCYEQLAHKLMSSYMIEKEAKIVLSKLISILGTMDNMKKSVISLFYGLENGIPLDFDEISNRLHLEKQTVYSILSCSYSFLRRRFYSFIQEKEPSLNFYLYNFGISSQCFRRMKDISLQDFIELSPRDLKKIAKSNNQYVKLMLVQSMLKDHQPK